MTIIIYVLNYCEAYFVSFLRHAGARKDTRFDEIQINTDKIREVLPGHPPVCRVGRLCYRDVKSRCHSYGANNILWLSGVISCIVFSLAHARFHRPSEPKHIGLSMCAQRAFPAAYDDTPPPARKMNRSDKDARPHTFPKGKAAPEGAARHPKSSIIWRGTCAQQR